MKSFNALLVLLAIVAVSADQHTMSKSHPPPPQQKTPSQMLSSSYGGSSGGGGGGGYGASIPAPPCPSNYLFSCQPNLSPAPCAQQSSGGYGSAGAYSQHLPVYSHLPVQVPLAYGLNGYQTY